MLEIVFAVISQKAIAKECADWISRKALFRSNKTKAAMQPFACIKSEQHDAAYIPLHGFTAVDLGYQQGDAISNYVNKIKTPLNEWRARRDSNPRPTA